MVAIDDEWSKFRLLSERFTIYPLFSKANYLPFNFPINCLKAGKIPQTADCPCLAT